MSESDQKRLVITEDELSAAAQTAGARPTQPLPTVSGAVPSAGYAAPAVAAKAIAPAPAVTFLRTVQGRNLAAAACGITLGWAICEITGFGLWTSTSAVGLEFSFGAYAGAVGLCLAVVYAGWEQILARSWEGTKLAILRAGPWGFGLAFAAGFVAQMLYRHFVLQIARGLTLSDLLHISSNAKLYLTRSLGWGLFGLGMGIAVAGGLKARDKVINGVVGGAVGGTLGGLFFHWASFNISSGTTARLIGLLVVGLAIGMAIGLVEKVRRDAWMQIATGPMAGKEFIVYGEQCTVGSSPKCDITLIKDATIAPFHALIRTVGGPAGGARVLDAYENCALSINGLPSTHHRLRSGDMIGIGAMTIAYSERTT